jgi:hypothetical protein
MLYVKTSLTDDITIMVDIVKENVYTQCPGCGAEMSVDLDQIVKDNGGDLNNTEAFCSKCLEQIKREKSGAIPQVTKDGLMWLEDALRKAGHEELISDLHDEYEIDSPRGLLISQYSKYGEALVGIVSCQNVK